MGGAKYAFILLVVGLPYIFGVPVSTTEDMVVVTETQTSDDGKEVSTEDGVVAEPKITEMYIRSNVSNRFATTVVRSKVKNFGKTAKETNFFVVIPEKAFISQFIMEIGGVNYTAYVQEKEQAKQTYQKAVSSGAAAAHVTARDSNKFSVDVNIEPESKAIFYLTYEELLERKDENYELQINIHPKQLVKNIHVEVFIEELRKITSVKTPHIQSGNEITKESEDLNSDATITQSSPNSAHVVFNPNLEKQKQIARGLGTEEKEGISGQFIVNYDVERDPSGGEVLVKDGFFVHFFAPTDVKPLKKHVVFVLDTSGSMYGTKMTQLKAAMTSIINDLKPEDFFSLVEFNSNVKVWNLDAPSESTMFPKSEDNWYNTDDVFSLEDVSFPPAYPVNNKTITKANKAVSELTATGGTNIYEALRVALRLIRLRQERNGKIVQPIVFFLTDGDPTVGRTDTTKIISGISEDNVAKVPIISLSFGTGADKRFLEKISLQNFGFARHIYEDSDASLQLENFYQEVSSPLLKDVKFEYTPDATSLTKVEFPVYFSGAEFVVAGRIPDDGFKSSIPRVSCTGIIGPIILNTTVTKSVGQLERLWAYMTTQKYLDAKKVNESLATEYDKKALDLALKYSFVTPVTSLVVVKPNATEDAVDAEAADENNSGRVFYNSAPQSSLAALPPLYSGGFAAGAPSGYGAAGGAPLPTATFDKIYHTTPAYFRPPPPPQPQAESAVDIDSDSVPYEEAEDGIDNVSVSAATEAVTTTEEPVPATLPPDVAPALKWLEKYLRPDGSLGFLNGNYQLGFNETSPAAQDCTTPDSEEGACKLIKDCNKLYPKLTDKQAVKDYFCAIDKFAGVCCPIN